MTGTDERRGEWSKYYPYFLIAFIISMGICGALASYAREISGSWTAYLITPLVGTAFMLFILTNRRRFDARTMMKLSPCAVCASAEGRCGWCNEPCTGAYCTEECEAAYVKFEHRLDRNAHLFTPGLMIPIVLLVAFLSAGDVQLGIGLMMLGYGALLIVLPLTIPGTASPLGIKRSLTIARIVGLIILICGAAMVIYAPPM